MNENQKLSWKRLSVEAAAIVGSILLAFAIDAWWEDRNRRIDEVEILGQFVVTLNGDIRGLESHAARFQGRIDDITEIVSHIENQRPYEDRLSSLFSSCVGWDITTPNPGPYEALKSKGLDLIQDQALIMKLIDYYERKSLTVVTTSDENRRYNMQAVIPYYDRHFYRSEDGKTVPVDYEHILVDPLFLNICKHKQYLMQAVVLPSYKRAIDQAASLISDIESELQDRK
jgi:hypothetical protein